MNRSPPTPNSAISKIGALGDGGTGVARAWLSDGYKPIDHLDTLMAVLDTSGDRNWPLTTQVLVRPGAFHPLEHRLSTSVVVAAQSAER